MAGADDDDGREGDLYLPAAQCTQCPRRVLLSVMSAGTREVGILPVEMQRERFASEGWPRAWWRASAWSARMRCSPVM